MALRLGRSRLPDLLKQSKMNQAEYARRIGVSDSFVTRVINGEKKLSLVKAKESAIIFGCYIDDLYEWEITSKR